MTTALFIEGGAVSRVKLPGDNTFDAIRSIIGGYLEPVRSADGRVTLWCNEDGKPLRLPANGIATALWFTLQPSAPKNDRLRGPVVVTGAQGDDTILAVPEDIEAMFENWVSS